MFDSSTFVNDQRALHIADCKFQYTPLYILFIVNKFVSIFNLFIFFSHSNLIISRNIIQITTSYEIFSVNSYGRQKRKN